MRSFSRIGLGPLSQQAVIPTASSRLTGTATSYSVPQLIAVRCRASHLRIANRKRVEQFVGKRFHLPTRLRTAAPDIAREWDYEKNEMHVYPEIIGIGHMEPVWWRCGQCDGTYHMSVEKRVLRGGSCPHCTHKASEEKRLQTEYGSSSSEEKEHVSASSSEEEAYMDIDDLYAQQESAIGTAETSEPKEIAEEDLLEGEKNLALRPKRPTAFTLRTKY